MAVSRFVLLAPNYVDSEFAPVDLTMGGAWELKAPWANVRNPRLVNAAVSKDVSLQSTQGLIDFGQARGILGVAMLVRGSRDLKAKFLLTQTADINSTVIADSGWIQQYGVIYKYGSLSYQDPHWLDGRILAEDIPLFTMPVFFVWPNIQVSQYLWVIIDDSSSPLRSVAVQRVLAASQARPSFNFDYGATIGVESRTNVVEAWGGVEYFDNLKGRRVVHCSIDYLPEDEALATFLDLQQQIGVTGQVFFSWDPADTVNQQRRSFLGRCRVLTALEAAAVGQMKVTLEISEIIG